jgi:uncharacterized membrane protein
MIVSGTAEAFVKGLIAMPSSPLGHAARKILLWFGRWLVATLTYQLAAESWEAIGRIAAITVIRAFLNYFLEYDLTGIPERQKRHAKGAILAPRKPYDYSDALSGAIPGETPRGS